MRHPASMDITWTKILMIWYTAVSKWLQATMCFYSPSLYIKKFLTLCNVYVLNEYKELCVFFILTVELAKVSPIKWKWYNLPVENIVVLVVYMDLSDATKMGRKVIQMMWKIYFAKKDWCVQNDGKNTDTSDIWCMKWWFWYVEERIMCMWWKEGWYNWCVENREVFMCVEE